MNVAGALTIATGVALGILVAVGALAILTKHGGMIAGNANSAWTWLHVRRWGIAGAAAVVLLGVGGAAFEAERKQISRNVEDARIAAERETANQARRQREREATELAQRRFDCRRELDGWNRYVAERQRANMPIRIDIIAERADERDQCEKLLAQNLEVRPSAAKQAMPVD